MRRKDFALGKPRPSTAAEIILQLIVFSLLTYILLITHTNNSALLLSLMDAIHHMTTASLALRISPLLSVSKVKCVGTGPRTQSFGDAIVPEGLVAVLLCHGPGDSMAE